MNGMSTGTAADRSIAYARTIRIVSAKDCAGMDANTLWTDAGG